jgi:hypothetical protein
MHKYRIYWHTYHKNLRFIPANAELLQEKIGELSNRVRQLEDALSQSHSSHSKDPHPLLKAELLMINQPLRKEKPTGSSTEEESLLKSIGSLYVAVGCHHLVLTCKLHRSISPQGQETWFGETVNSWVCSFVILLQASLTSGVGLTVSSASALR